MSPLVTRPSLPVPGTVAGSTPLSAASLRTDGASGSSSDATLAARRRGRRRRLRRLGSAARPWRGRLGGGRLGGAAWRPRRLPGSGRAARPTATVSPSLAAISASTPAAGAGTSIVTLSVSSSTSGSSTATASPGFLNQRPMVASVTDSPSVGTRISAMTADPRSLVMPTLCRASTSSCPAKQDVDRVRHQVSRA